MTPLKGLKGQRIIAMWALSAANSIRYNITVQALVVLTVAMLVTGNLVATLNAINVIKT
jgi:hypothetical protein